MNEFSLTKNYFLYNDDFIIKAISENYKKGKYLSDPLLPVLVLERPYLSYLVLQIWLKYILITHNISTFSTIKKIPQSMHRLSTYGMFKCIYTFIFIVIILLL